MIGEKGTITLYLSGWQKRILADALPQYKKASTLTLCISDSMQDDRMYVIAYMVPDPPGPVACLHLTDEQIAIIKEKTGLKTKITAINVNPGLIKNNTLIFK